MEIVLEYTYTGSIKEESLTKDNLIEGFYAADYFQLPDLQDFIMKTFKNTLEKDYNENYAPELLSKLAEKMPLTENNILLNLLIEVVAAIPLNTIEFGRLSIAGLQCLLSCTHEKEKRFATPEYEVFRYSAILVAKQVSNDAYKALMEQLPTLEQIKQMENSVKVENKFITDHQKVAKELEPLVEFIDFRRIKGQVLVDIIEPLEIVPAKIILNVFRHYTKSSDSNLSDIRGIPVTICKINESTHIWDKSACGSNLIIEDNGKVVSAPNGLGTLRSVRAEMILENNGIFEWDVIIEKACNASWVGVCASENFNCEDWAGGQSTGWVLGSFGRYYNNGHFEGDYCPPFGDGAKITVHLDMNKRTCAFTVNGTKYPEVSTLNNLPSKLHPVASLRHPGRFRIQPHKKNI
ncbi:concanavalin A-like lectin/glucanase domain-containing protein [Rhizophagus clarus]|nr:concanavalin A-like lectin/glucanase domain-containing protein [Rhizophagus clarus]